MDRIAHLTIYVAGAQIICSEQEKVTDAKCSVSLCILARRAHDAAGAANCSVISTGSSWYVDTLEYSLKHPLRSFRT